ncbi:MAG: hypothetical protein HC795_05185 [Coleofasciculaceae cyanobacterium RL_1_1]|nr:hypothetical protein [Coleofasciculaceae cyanobacterium RL_1_1]
MKSTTNSNSNNQGMPGSKPTVTLTDVTLTGNTAADDANTPDPTPANITTGTNLNNNDLFGDTIIRTYPGVTTLTPSPLTIDPSIVGVGTFALTVDFSQAMDTAIDPTISFPTSGEDPSSTITFNMGSWSDADTYLATYDVATPAPSATSTLK